VAVTLHNGKRRSKLIDYLDLAKKVGAKLKTDSVENKTFNRQKSPLISGISISPGQKSTNNPG